MASNSREAVTPAAEQLSCWLHRMYCCGLTTTTGGNLSIIDDDDTLYITPSGGDKAIIPPSNMALRRPGKTKFEGPLPPSMEWPLHTAAYRARPDCKAVLHAHSMTLVAFSLGKAPSVSLNINVDARLPDTRCLLGAWQSCGKVALAPYAIPGTTELAEVCVEGFKTGADCVILQNHGVVTVGATMQQAFNRFVSLEFLAQSIVNSVPLGIPRPLPARILEIARSKEHARHSDPFPGPVTMCPCGQCCCHKQRLIDGPEKVARMELCKFVKRAYERKLIISSSGSFSVRVHNPRVRRTMTALSFLVTPTNVDRHSLEPSDLCYVSRAEDTRCRHELDCIIDKNKRQKHGEGPDALEYHPLHVHRSLETTEPSRATAVHATIYAAHPSIGCIMVVQPPYATAYCITGTKFNSAGIPESHIILHEVQTVPLESVLKDNGADIAKALDPASGRNTVLVEGYGLIAVGKDALKAFVQVEVCESMCGVELTALRRGPTCLLTKEQVKDIDECFKVAH